MGRRPESMSSTTSSSSVSPTKAGESDDGKWYPGKFLGRKKKDSNGMDSSQRSSSSHVDEEEHQLICIGCRYGETPGIQAKGLLKNLYKEYRSQNLNARILSPAKSYSLSYGSLYGEGDKSEKCLRRVDGQPAHDAGYFEILNKSDFATAIRVCNGGSESLREHCRPSYITGMTLLFLSLLLLLFLLLLDPLSPHLSLPRLVVLPQQSVYTLFDPSTRSLEVAVLHRNPYFITSNTPMNSLIYNTRGEEVTKEMISPQCAVQNFSEICIYSILCEGKNVILKYQGAGVIELRKLTTTKRNKKGTLNFISSMLSSSSSSSGSFSTNPQQSSPLPSPSPTNASSTTALAPQQSGTAGAGAGWGDGKECILDFSTNATEISRDMASNLF
jgi:hypothetical protein